MTAISYVAKRSIQSGHTADTTYSFDIGMGVINRKNTFYGVKKKTIMRKSVSHIDAIEESFALETVPVQINSTAHKNMREFLDSCLPTEQFSMDLYGTVSVPDVLKLCELTIDEYVETRVSTTNYVVFSFEVRVVA